MKVTMRKASDGAFFEKHADFAAHEAKLRLMKNLKDVTFDMSDFSPDEYGNVVMYADNIGEFIKKNAATLRALLNDVMVVRRKSPRAVKNAAV